MMNFASQKSFKSVLLAGALAASLAVPVAASATSGPAQLGSGNGSSHSKMRSLTAHVNLKGNPAQTQGSYSYNWGLVSGNTWYNLTISGLPVSPGQAVAVSITEADANGKEVFGMANTHCENVSVNQWGIQIRCIINWNSPLRIRTHYVY